MHIGNGIRVLGALGHGHQQPIGIKVMPWRTVWRVERNSVGNRLDHSVNTNFKP